MRDFYPIEELFFCDIETSGTKMQEHGVFEFSWAVGLGDIRTVFATRRDMEYLIEIADPKALEVNGYSFDVIEERAMPAADFEQGLVQFAEEVKGKIWVNANPAFDARFMSNLLWNQGHPNNEPWFYRLLDIQAYEAGLSRGKMMGLSHLVPHYKSMGYSITPNDHTSKNDVAATRDLWLAIVDKYNLDRE